MHTQLLRSVLRPILETYRSKILSGFLKNPVPKGQVKTITFMLFGMCNWIYAWYDPKGTVNPDELSEIIWAVFLRGIEDFK